MTIAAYLRWSRSGRIPPAQVQPPPKPEWEQLMDEIADARTPSPGDLDRARGPREPDRIVFGDWHPPAALGFAAGPADSD